jgi:hypothetical protein
MCYSKKYDLLRSTPEKTSTTPEYSGVLRSTPEKTCTTPEYSGKNMHYSGVLRSTPKKHALLRSTPELLRGAMLQLCLCVILMMESLEGKEEEVPLPQSSFYSSSSDTKR